MTIGAFSIGSHGLPETLLRGTPTVTVTAPTGTITTTTITVTWTYSSPVSRAQLWYRVRLLTEDGTQLLDTGMVASADVSYLMDSVVLAGFTNYQVEVTASDGLDQASDLTSFFVELVDVGDYPDEPGVGSIYEVAINGTGFMLTDYPDQSLTTRRATYQSQSAPLDAPRFATGDTPFNEAIDRYTFLGYDDWSGGAGQKFLGLASSDPTRYYDSEGIDPFTEPGSLKLIESMDLEISSSYTAPKCVVAGSQVFMATSTTELTAKTAAGGSSTTFTAIGAAGSGTWLASDGKHWYWSNGTDITRNNAAIDPGSNWSTVAVTEIGWCSDRLAGVSGGDTLTTFADDGTEEVPSGRFTFPGALVAGLCGGDGYLWFGVNRGTSSEIHAWQLGSTDSDFIALNLPAGETINSLFFYLGNVFVATTVESKTRLYRCIPSSGTLTPDQFLTESHGGDVYWAGSDRYVAFGWQDMTSASRSGIGLFDLSTGGYAKWYSADVGGTPAIYGVVRWEGYFGFTVASSGFYSPAQNQTILDSGWLMTSATDLSSGLVKTFDDAALTTEPLVAGNTVQLEWSPNTFTTWLDIATFDSAAATSALYTIGSQARQIAIRITLGTTDVSPIVQHVQVKLHPVSPADKQIVLPLLCSDHAKGLNGGALRENRTGRSIELLGFLESLVSKRVRLQDITWPVTRMAQIYDVVGVQTFSTSGVFDHQLNRRSDEFIVQLTLRRAL